MIGTRLLPKAARAPDEPYFLHLAAYAVVIRRMECPARLSAPTLQSGRHGFVQSQFLPSLRVQPFTTSPGVAGYHFDFLRGQQARSHRSAGQCLDVFSWRIHVRRSGAGQSAGGGHGDEAVSASRTASRSAPGIDTDERPSHHFTRPGIPGSLWNSRRHMHAVKNGRSGQDRRLSFRRQAHAVRTRRWQLVVVGYERLRAARP